MSEENKVDSITEKTVNKYAILQETSGEESESWLYFIKYNGNEEALEYLQKQLKQVRWYIIEDLSTFDLETDFLVSESTAKEMTKVDLNHYSPHRKFDGKLKMIDLNFKDKYKNEKKMAKTFDVLGYGKIDRYIDQEDIDPEDLISNSQESDTSSGSDCSSSEEGSESSEEVEKKKGTVPKVAVSRLAQIKRKHK